MLVSLFVSFLMSSCSVLFFFNLSSFLWVRTVLSFVCLFFLPVSLLILVNRLITCPVFDDFHRAYSYSSFARVSKFRWVPTVWFFCCVVVLFLGEFSWSCSSFVSLSLLLLRPFSFRLVRLSVVVVFFVFFFPFAYLPCFRGEHSVSFFISLCGLPLWLQKVGQVNAGANPVVWGLLHLLDDHQ